jgi:DeoR/GlpR family transcriptional regulator of sugar metabolism
VSTDQTPSEAVSGFHQDERAAHLLDLLARQSSASLAEMQAVTGASLPTLRRDLTALERQGLLQRVRGGARMVTRSSPLDETWDLRRRRNASAKGAVAIAAAKLVTSRMSIFLPDGTSAFAVAEELRRLGRPLSIATTGLYAARCLAGVPGIDLTVLGGQLRDASYGMVGPLTRLALETLRADIAFITADALDETGPIDNNSLDAEVARVMSANAARTVVLADSSKIGPGGAVRVFGWREVDDLIIDGTPAGIAEALEETGVRVTVAPRLSG